MARSLPASRCVSIDPETMAEPLASETYEGSLRAPRPGDLAAGAVASLTGDEARVDLGDRPAGVLQLRGEEQVSVGDATAATVVQPEGPDGRVVLSSPRARKAEGAARLREGDVLDGTVVSVTSYGLFVDVGVADGLVHRSDITWVKGIEPTSLYRVGQRIRARWSGWGTPCR